MSRAPLSTAERDRILDIAVAIGKRAGEIILDVYKTNFAVDYKGPNDPVTRADREANEWICSELARHFPGVPIVAEESAPEDYGPYQTASVAWFVDPLDGTREFVLKNGEFAVMIGLVENGGATLGVLVCPAIERTFIGAEGVGAFEVDAIGKRTPIATTSCKRLEEATIVVSRSHRSEAIERALASLGTARAIPTGSSGLKAAKIAAGEADIYIQPGRAGKRWDACAPEAIVRAAGGIATDTHGDPFRYDVEELENIHGLVATNAHLHADVLARLKAMSGG